MISSRWLEDCRLYTSPPCVPAAPEDANIVQCGRSTSINAPGVQGARIGTLYIGDFEAPWTCSRLALHHREPFVGEQAPRDRGSRATASILGISVERLIVEIDVDVV